MTRGWRDTARDSTPESGAGNEPTKALLRHADAQRSPTLRSDDRLAPHPVASLYLALVLFDAVVILAVIEST